MTCPHLSYRRESDDRSFETPRAYCTVADRFVQPMRADICNDRYDLDHAEHCEIFLAAERDSGATEESASGRSDDGDSA